MGWGTAKLVLGGVTAAASVLLTLHWQRRRRQRALPATAPPGQSRADCPPSSAPCLPVGVRTITVDVGLSVDVAALIDSAPTTLPTEIPRTSRALRCEVWYPCMARRWNQVYLYPVTFGSTLDPRRPLRASSILGRALRNTPPCVPAGDEPRYPLVIFAHGYNGHRLQLLCLAENLASQGYIVLALDHAGYTNADASPVYGATPAFWHAPLDVRAVIAEIQKMDDDEAGSGGRGGPLE